MIYIFLLLINLLTFTAYWWDKRQARWNEWRIPEAVLLLLGAAGGSAGAFIAQRVVRHKTKKQPFQMIFWIIVAAQIYGVFIYISPPPAPI